MPWHRLKDLLSKFDSDSRKPACAGKYVSREFQAFGCYLAEQLNDLNHKSLYIKLAKTEDRRLLENALQYVQDSHARSKPRLFMWKIKQLKQQT